VRCGSVRHPRIVAPGEESAPRLRYRAAP
jgi:hypothetical protein